MHLGRAKEPVLLFEHQHAENRIFVPYLCPALNEKIAPTDLINVSRRISFSEMWAMLKYWCTISQKIYFILLFAVFFFLQIDSVDFSWNSSNERKNILMRSIWTAMRIRRLKIPRTASVHIETRDNNNKYRPKKKKKERKKKSWKERNDDADIRDESWARKRPS
jgi:hypothetical protein